MADPLEVKTADATALTLATGYLESHPGARLDEPSLLAQLGSHLDGIADADARDGAYASMAAYLAAGVSAATVTALLGRVADPKMASDGAIGAARAFYTRGQGAAGAAMLRIAEARIRVLQVPQARIQSLIDYAATRKTLGLEIADPLESARQLLAKRLDGAWGIDRYLDIADLEREVGDGRSAEVDADAVIPTLWRLADSDEKDMLLDRASGLYLLLRRPDKALALVRALSPAARPLSARTAAQRVLLDQGDYATAQALIALVEVPYERLLAWDIWLSSAQRNDDRWHAEQAERAILDLIPELRSSPHKFQALMLLASYRVNTADNAKARQLAAQARAQLDDIAPAQQEGYREQLRWLNAVIGD